VSSTVAVSSKIVLPPAKRTLLIVDEVYVSVPLAVSAAATLAAVGMRRARVVARARSGVRNLVYIGMFLPISESA
jgi:hypothetical protein